MKRVGPDGKAKPGTYTLSQAEAKKLRKLVRWMDDVLDSVPDEERRRRFASGGRVSKVGPPLPRPETLGELLHMPVDGEAKR